MKRYFITLLLLSFWTISFSQVYYMPTSHNAYVPIPMHYGSSNQLTHYKYNYTVVYKSHKTAQIEGKIDYDKKSGKYFLKSKKTKIYCDETDSIYRIDKSTNETISGRYNNNKWLFPVIHGRIKGYSVYSSNEESYITHIQKDDSEIVEYDRTFLKKEFPTMIQDNSESYKLYLKDKRNRKIRTYAPPIIFVTCITISVVAPPESALMIAAWLSAPVLPFAPYLLVKRISPIEIINKYNDAYKVDK